MVSGERYVDKDKRAPLPITVQRKAPAAATATRAITPNDNR
jgi:hypothetical protein